MSKMPRIQAVVLPILNSSFEGANPQVTVNTWVPAIKDRKFPFVLIRRVGGPRHAKRPTQLALPVIEMTAYNTTNLIETDRLYDDALEALYAAVRNQTQTDAGYLHSMKETLGATEADSPFQDSWSVFGLIQLGLRPPHSQ